LVLPTLALAQQAVIVPPTHATADAGSMAWVAGSVDLRQQILIDGVHLAPLVGTSLTSLTFRRDTSHRGALAAFTGDVVLSLSTSPHASSAQTSETMAANAGADERLVFRGPMVAPASPAPLGATVPWDAQNTIEIAFTQPFPYRGGTLCIDLRGMPVGANAWWPVDVAQDLTAGQVRYVGASCHDPQIVATVDKTRTHTVSESTLIVGNSVRSFARGTPNALASLLVGLRELTPPVDLGAVGAPGCRLSIEPLAALPTQQVSAPIVPALVHIGGYVSATLHVPSDGALFDAQFALQWLEWQGGRIATSNAAVCTIARTVPTLGMAVVSARYEGGAPPARGRVDRTTGYVVRLGYR
jgi:hypothetical protein